MPAGGRLRVISWVVDPGSLVGAFPLSAGSHDDEMLCEGLNVWVVNGGSVGLRNRCYNR